MTIQLRRTDLTALSFTLTGVGTIPRMRRHRYAAQMKNLMIALLLTPTPPSTEPGHIEPGYIVGSLQENPRPMPAALKAMDAQWEMDYRTLRRALFNTGWVGLPREYSHPTVLGFPEVNCGQGWQAVCSSIFRKGKQELFLLLHPTGTKLILIGAD